MIRAFLRETRGAIERSVWYSSRMLMCPLAKVLDLALGAPEDFEYESRTRP